MFFFLLAQVMSKLYKALVITTALLFLIACGQKGALYLPQSEHTSSTGKL